MARVYIVNKSGHDYSDSERFGEAHFLTEGTLDRFNTNQMLRIITDALKDSQGEDYILLTSLTTLCVIACSVFASKHGRLNLLLFKDGKYIERRHVFN